MVTIKFIIAFIILYIPLYAKDTFVSFGYMNSLEYTSSHIETNDGYSYISESDSHALSLEIGQKLNIYDTYFRFEPSLGVMLYEHDTYTLTMLFIEVPILYSFNLLSQNISIGPSAKLHYVSNIEEHGVILTSGTTFNSSYNFKFILEKNNFDYFIFYEHISDKVFFYGRDSNTIVSGHVNMQSDYIGAGVRIKY